MSDAPPTDPRDRIAITELTAAYNQYFDDADGAGWASTFTKDGALEVTDQGVVYEGRTDLAHFCTTRGWGYLHLTTDHMVTVDGNVGFQRCNLLMYRRFRDRRPPELLTTGRYTDRLARTPDGWFFARRAVTLDADLGGEQAGEQE